MRSSWCVCPSVTFRSCGRKRTAVASRQREVRAWDWIRPPGSLAAWVCGCQAWRRSTLASASRANVMYERSPILRAAARVLLIDELDRVLLLRAIVGEGDV